MNNKEKEMIKQLKRRINYAASNHDNQIEFRLVTHNDFGFKKQEINNIINYFKQRDYKVDLIKTSAVNFPIERIDGTISNKVATMFEYQMSWD